MNVRSDPQRRARPADSLPRGWWLVVSAALVAGAPAGAQDDDLDSISRPVIQAVPSRGSYELNAALTRLAVNPRDIDALIAAGNAALALGDTEAAMGFLGRADQLAPGNPRVKSSLASAMVRSENPYDAIRLFEDAERAGANDAMLAGDRGLAYDLVGDNVSAQRFYRQALARGASDEIGRRLALSLAIGGDRKASEAALLPQLQRQDPAAWRTRAFALAILGDEAEAVKIAYGTMPRDLADGIAAYLRYMPRLTPAQQAAAANFGHFPRAAQIGRDDPRAARFASAAPRRAPRGADAGLIPEGQPLGQARKPANSDDKSGRERRRRPDKAAQTAAVAAAPAPRIPLPAPRPTPAAQARTAMAPPVLAAPKPISTPPAVRIAAATPPRPSPAPTPIPTPTPTPPPLAAPAVATTPAPLRVAIAEPPRSILVPPPAAVAAPAPAPGAASIVLPTAAGRTAPAPSGPALVLPSPSPPSAPPAAAVASPGPALVGPADPSAATAPLPSSSLDLARRAQQSAEAGLVPSSPPRRIDLSEAFSDFRPPAEEARSVAAVDISRIAPAKPRPPVVADDRGPVPGAPSATRRTAAVEVAAGAKGAKAQPGKATAPDKAKPAAPSHPSRIWVQVATGRDKAALGFDWRRLTREATEPFRNRKGWTTPWGQANRLLVGPFESQAAAQAFLKELARKDVEGFIWTSAAGQAIDPLVVK